MVTINDEEAKRLKHAFNKLSLKIVTKGKLESCKSSIDNDSPNGKKDSPDSLDEEDFHSEGPGLISEFMKLAGERITWVESKELWHDMTSTNISKLPSLSQSLHDSLHSIYSSRHGESTTESTEVKLKEINIMPLSSNESNKRNDQQEKLDLLEIFGSTENDLTSNEIVEIAKMIKETYGIRLKNDKSEFKFICFTLSILWTIFLSFVCISNSSSSKAKLLGSLTWPVIIEAVILFIAELLWECLLSAIVLRYNIKINYTRKLGNLFKIPKYFAADLFPFYKSTAVSLVSTLTINQTLFCAMYYRKSREVCKFFSYVFLSQDRREDRPDTLIFQVTEDLLRFVIYIPFKLMVANRLGAPHLIFIPIAVNNIGDGLAEPVGVAFGKHKFTTTALYHRGRFFKSKFTRSYEGSSCVFFTTLIVVALNYTSFTKSQFWITLSVLPFLMTVAEAKAPHTNDGPFLALIGCSFLTIVMIYA